MFACFTKCVFTFHTGTVSPCPRSLVKPSRPRGLTKLFAMLFARCLLMPLLSMLSTSPCRNLYMTISNLPARPLDIAIPSAAIFSRASLPTLPARTACYLLRLLIGSTRTNPKGIVRTEKGGAMSTMAIGACSLTVLAFSLLSTLHRTRSYCMHTHMRIVRTRTRLSIVYATQIFTR